MSLTLSIDDRLVEEARKAAAAMGKTVDQLIVEYLQQLTGAATCEEDLAELRRLSGRRAPSIGAGFAFKGAQG